MALLPSKRKGIIWAKDYYQEQILGYLDWVQTEIEHLEQACIRRNDLEIALKRLWQLIRCSELDWERFRYPSEASYDELLHMFYHVPSADSLIFAVRLTTTGRSQVWEQAEMLS
jgi:hypothetical protein